ncbi:MAG: Na+/H+ antiporter subunit G [Planctomycetota bacterium]|nr:Na+/H+ antiporter subunit G [Planctomycetota bacterium]
MNSFFEALIALHIVVGAFFIFVGSFGLLKLPSFMSRLHAPSKSTTLGVGGCLVASMLQLWAAAGTISVHETLITFFLFMTAPVTAHFLALAYLHTQRSIDESLPKPSPNSNWSTLLNEESMTHSNSVRISEKSK